MSSSELNELARRIEAIAPGVLRRDVDLHRLTSFQIGGPADLYLEPPDRQVLAAAFHAARDLGVPVTRLGGGTNILMADAGVRGLAVRLGKPFEKITWNESGGPVHNLSPNPVDPDSGSGNTVDGGAAGSGGSGQHGDRERGGPRVGVVEAGAAARLIRLAKDSVSRGYAGLEFAAGIPGSVGGGTLMNAGAFGGEIGAAITNIAAVTLEGKIADFSRSDVTFAYRRLALPTEAMVTSVKFTLHGASVGALKQVVAKVQAKRRRNQPAGVPNAGSIFKNPPNEFAGRLIEKAGLKGSSVGGALVSPDHANFIVNAGGATAADVRDLMCMVQNVVWERCGVWLEPEVRLVGEWG